MTLIPLKFLGPGVPQEPSGRLDMKDREEGKTVREEDERGERIRGFLKGNVHLFQVPPVLVST